MGRKRIGYLIDCHVDGLSQVVADVTKIDYSDNTVISRLGFDLACTEENIKLLNKIANHLIHSYYDGKHHEFDFLKSINPGLNTVNNEK